MASRAVKSLELDAEVIERARDATRSSAEVPDADVVTRVLEEYLGRQGVEIAQAMSEYDEQEAMRVAYDELRAMRRERGNPA